MSDRSETRRRAFLAGLAATGAGLAGCQQLTSDGGSDGGSGGGTSPTPTATPTETPTDSPTDSKDDSNQQKQSNDPGSPKPMEPAAASFEDLSYWTSDSGVKLQADSETYYQGTQSARIEGRSGTIRRQFPVPVNLQGKDLSLALKIGGPLPTTVRIYLYDTGGNTTRLLQNYHGKQPDGWVRVNPSINSAGADMSSIEQVLITIDGPAPNKKYWVDDLKFHDKAAKQGQVMFSFDYITRSIYEVAFPMMQDRGIKGAVAVPADNVGNADRLNWDELKEMQNAGWEICSMTNDWESMYGQSKNIQRQRMERAIRLIKDNGLGTPKALMYPKGFADNTTYELAQELHDISFVRYGNTEAGLSQSAIMGPAFVNRSRPNTPEAVKNQLGPISDYNGLYTIVHNRIGGDAQNTRSEFRAMLDTVRKRQNQGDIQVVTPSDVIL